MKTSSTLQALCEGKPPVSDEFSSQRPNDAEFWLVLCRHPEWISWWTNNRLACYFRRRDAHVRCCTGRDFPIHFLFSTYWFCLQTLSAFTFTVNIRTRSTDFYVLIIWMIFIVEYLQVYWSQFVIHDARASSTDIISFLLYCFSLYSAYCHQFTDIFQERIESCRHQIMT